MRGHSILPVDVRRRFPPTLADLGPGLILAATGIGVGDMVSATIAGAEYGLTLIWALGAGVLVKFAITEGAARWQLSTDTTLVEGWRNHLPGVAVVAFFIYFVVWSYTVSSALVAASALVPAAVVPSVPLPVWGFVHAVAAFVMVYFDYLPTICGASFSFSQICSISSVSGSKSNDIVTVHGLTYALASSMVN